MTFALTLCLDSLHARGEHRQGNRKGGAEGDANVIPPFQWKKFAPDADSIGRPWIIPLELSRRFEPSIRNRVENQRDCSPFRALTLTMNGAGRASGQAGIALTTERTKGGLGAPADHARRSGPSDRVSCISARRSSAGPVRAACMLSWKVL